MFSASLGNLTHCEDKTRDLVKCSITPVASTSPNPTNWRTIHCRLSATASSKHSQLPSILEVVHPTATCGRAMPWRHSRWLLTARRHVTAVRNFGTLQVSRRRRTLTGITTLRQKRPFCYGETQSQFTVCCLQWCGNCKCNNGGRMI